MSRVVLAQTKMKARAGKFRSAGKTGLNKRVAFNLTARRSSSLPALLLLIPNVLKKELILVPEVWKISTSGNMIFRFVEEFAIWIIE